jgi:CHASE2 domain-containing sensor protein
MTNLTEIGLIVAIFLAGMHIYLVLEKMRKERENEIVTGVVRGVAVSTGYRWFSLYTYWATPVCIQMGFTLTMITVYLLMAENADGDGAKFAAYLVLFFSSIGMLGSIGLAYLGYIRLASVLRQAEAD